MANQLCRMGRYQSTCAYHSRAHHQGTSPTCAQWLPNPARKQGRQMQLCSQRSWQLEQNSGVNGLFALNSYHLLRPSSLTTRMRRWSLPRERLTPQKESRKHRLISLSSISSIYIRHRNLISTTARTTLECKALEQR